MPESELDRFFLQLSVGYPPYEDELRILKDYVTMASLESIGPVMTSKQVLEIQKAVSAVRVDDSVVAYMLDIVTATREASEVDIGISPRGSLALYRGVKALALVEGRDYVIPDDVKRMCPPVFLHRLVCRGSRDRSANGLVARALDNILETIPVPA